MTVADDMAQVERESREILHVEELAERMSDVLCRTKAIGPFDRQEWRDIQRFLENYASVLAEKSIPSVRRTPIRHEGWYLCFDRDTKAVRTRGYRDSRWFDIHGNEQEELTPFIGPVVDINSEPPNLRRGITLRGGPEDTEQRARFEAVYSKEGRSVAEAKPDFSRNISCLYEDTQIRAAYYWFTRAAEADPWYIAQALKKAE